MDQQCGVERRGYKYVHVHDHKYQCVNQGAWPSNIQFKLSDDDGMYQQEMLMKVHDKSEGRKGVECRVTCHGA